MRIVLANPRGFCAGVRMAIDVVDELLGLCPDEPIHVYHEIVHNRHVVGRFRDRGVVFVERVEDAPDGCLLVFSAHGVSPAVRAAAAARGIRAIDATCPLVTKVHMEAIRYARQGYEILLVGHANHQEVIGTRGEAPASIRVVETPEDARSIVVRDPERVAYLTQTTLSMDDAEAIISVLRERFPSIKEPPGGDICYATTNRQRAVRAIAPTVDRCLVIGSTNSSNSVRLTEIAESSGCSARLIDDVSEIDEGWLGGAETVLVTAGASAPEDLVAGLCRALVERFGATIEIREVFEEDVEFNLPAGLRSMMRERGMETAGRKVRVSAPVVTEALYGAVPLTVSAGGGG
ncbi:MAG: 4-hydroxy-3-methylbut-2-enyl diphosphate reductase [Phycisphaerales bacterium]